MLQTILSIILQPTVAFISTLSYEMSKSMNYFLRIIGKLFHILYTFIIIFCNGIVLYNLLLLGTRYSCHKLFIHTLLPYFAIQILSSILVFGFIPINIYHYFIVRFGSLSQWQEELSVLLKS